MFVRVVSPDNDAVNLLDFGGFANVMTQRCKWSDFMSYERAMPMILFAQVDIFLQCQFVSLVYNVVRKKGPIWLQLDFRFNGMINDEFIIRCTVVNGMDEGLFAGQRIVYWYQKSIWMSGHPKIDDD